MGSLEHELYAAFNSARAGSDTEWPIIRVRDEEKVKSRESIIRGLIAFNGELIDYGEYGIRKTMTDEELSSKDIRAMCVVPTEYAEGLLR